MKRYEPNEIVKLLFEKGYTKYPLSYDGDYWFCYCQMAMKWLREERWKYIEISFSVTLNGEPQYNFGVLNRSAQWVYRHKQPFSTYEEAVEAAIKYCLIELI